MKNFSDLLATEQHLAVSINNTTYSVGWAMPLEFDASATVIIDGIEILYLEDITLVHQDDLKNFIIESEYREAIAGPLLNEMIQNLDTFISEFISCAMIEIEN